MAELTAYIAQAVKAAGEGVRTSRELANIRSISITNASERFRQAWRLALTVPVDGRYLPLEGTPYALPLANAL